MNKEGIIIDGVNVKDCKRRIGKNSYCRYFKRPCADNNFNCIWKQHERLKEENERLKTQYNCYACGNCSGEEDYVNLAKHHKGLRKQFDEIVKRNNTLSLRIEELEKENEELKNRKDDYYVKTLDQEAQISDLIQENEELKEENKTLEQFLSKEPLALQALQKGYASYKKSTDVFYEMVKKYKQTLQEIRKIVLENPWEETDNWIKGKILEVLESEEK